ncbi:hypothetical protein [Nocardia brasiliensis]|uniref:hypothetical protein n=1 Tax=Nocardia brasiliensis TaxID=37326 RepID=UPI0033F62B33
MDNAHAIAGRIADLGGRCPAELEDRDGSLFATAIEPDDNYIRLIQLSPQHRAEMAEGDRLVHRPPLELIASNVLIKLVVRVGRKV